MAYKVIILYQLYMPSYFLGTFTEYPYYYAQLYAHLPFHSVEQSLFLASMSQR